MDDDISERKLFTLSPLAKAYDYFSLGVIFMVVVVFFAMLFGLIFKSPSNLPPQLINLKRHTSPYDTKTLRNLADSQIANVYQMGFDVSDSVTVLNAKIEQVAYKNEETDKTLKTAGVLIGIVLAVAGFFGIKSINDIREYSIKVAQSDAKLIAENTAKNTAIETAAQIRTELRDQKTLIQSLRNDLDELRVPTTDVDSSENDRDDDEPTFPL